MQRLLTVFGASLLVTALALLLMHVIPIKDNRMPDCCDQLNLEASYGFPLAFKQVYSGGFTGAGETTTTPGNMVVDGVVVFATTATVLSAVSIIRKRWHN